MHLTREEERILEGERGYASQVSMKILVTLGDLFGADQLIPVESTHIAGVSYKTLGDAVDFLEKLKDENATAVVRSTLNPCGLDLDNWSRFSVSKSLYEAQLKIVDLYLRIGVEPTLTCTPYYLKSICKGTHLAWSESSAISYVNSILGARTNREGGPSALASALIGKTANYGLHLDENRRGNFLVDVQVPLRDSADYGALGTMIGVISKMRVPVFEGLQKCTRDNLKSLGAAMAASGAVSLYHVLGKTPECIQKNNFESLWYDGKPEEILSVGKEDLEKTCSSLTTSTHERVDMAFVGCPHCSLSELKRIDGFVSGKKVKSDVRFWVCTSRRVKALAKKKGLINRLEKRGIEVYSDTCIVVTWLKEMGIDSVITNSAKTAYYAPQLCNVDVALMSLREMVEKATY